MLSEAYQYGKHRILCLPKYSAMGASSRLRTNQYLPYLTNEGVQVDVAPLFGDAYLSKKYSGKTSVWEVAKAYMRRLRVLLASSDYDVVWIEKEAFPWLPGWIEGLLRPRTKVVVDYDDAIFHNYDKHPLQVIRKLLGGKIDSVMRSADVVVAGNTYLSQRAELAGCRRVELIPTVVDLERYSPREQRFERSEQSAVVIGWIGSPSTAPYLKQVAPVLDRLQARHQIKCLAIGANPEQVVGTPFQAVPWTEESEVRQLQGIDIGIMPLVDGPWERGKCGYKLIQYMACGLPVVASPVGVNEEIVKDGWNGFLARDDEGWDASLTSLVRDAEMRAMFGARGRRLVEEKFCLQVQAPRLRRIFQSLVAD